MTQKGKHKLPEDFAISAAMREWADTKVPTLDVDYYHDEFCDHWIGHGKMMADWTRTWQNWMRRTDRGAGPGMYGPEDRSIIRKKPKLVQPTQMRLSETEQVWQRLDRLRNEAIKRGLTMGQARNMTADELDDYIKEKDDGACNA